MEAHRRRIGSTTATTSSSKVARILSHCRSKVFNVTKDGPSWKTRWSISHCFLMFCIPPDTHYCPEELARRTHARAFRGDGRRIWGTIDGSLFSTWTASTHWRVLEGRRRGLVWRRRGWVWRRRGLVWRSLEWPLLERHLLGEWRSLGVGLCILRLWRLGLHTLS